MLPPQMFLKKQGKLLGLELVRFISAMSVLIWHYQHFFFIADKPTNLVRDKQPLYVFLSLFYEHGYYGVEVFWCISGFIFFWKYRTAIANGAIGAKKFFILRFSRLYPLHIVTLFIVLFLQATYFSRQGYYFVYQCNDISHFLLQLVFASNWGLEKGASFNGPIWSVSVEVLIYIFFFLVLRYVGKSVLVNIGVLLLCLTAKYLRISSPIVDCLSFFYVGGLSAITFQYFEQTKFSKPLTMLASSIVFILPMIILGTRIYQHRYFPILFLITYLPVLLYAVTAARSLVVPSVVNAVIEVAGNMTYSSYLIHFPIQLVFALYFLGIGQPIPYYDLRFFLGFILATLVAAYFIYLLFEHPVQLYIRKSTK